MFALTFVLWGCGHRMVESKQGFAFGACKLTEYQSGAGAWDSTSSSIHIKCGQYPEAVVLSGSRLVGLNYEYKNNVLVIKYKSGRINRFQNSYTVGNDLDVAIDLARERAGE